MSYILSFLKGILMGACDVVPGVSGGTIAFITGIYQRLLGALDHINMKARKYIIKGEIRTFRSYIDGRFLVAVFGGIIVAVAGLASLLKGLLLDHPSLVWSFFGGLLLASSVVLALNVKRRTRVLITFLVGGIVIGVSVISLPLMEAQPSGFSTFLTGMIAIIAMILPGISGSYLLLVMNHYYHVLDIVHQFTQGAKTLIANGFQDTGTVIASLPWGLLCLFLGGVIVGLLLFSKVLHRLHRRYANRLYALLTGMIVGSLPMLRPRKKVLEYYQDSDGNDIPLVQKNILPPDTANVWICLGLFLLGVGIVLGIYFINQYFTTKHKTSIQPGN